MGDEYDYDYAAPDDYAEPDYADYGADPNEPHDRFNLEDLFIEAKNSHNPIESYRTIIEIETSNTSEVLWSFRSYEKLCLIHIQNLNFDDFRADFEKLFEIYPKIDDYNKQDTIRNLNYGLFDVQDKDFVVSVLDLMMQTLKEKSIDRAYMETGLQFAKTFLDLQRNDELSLLIDDLLNYLDRLPPDEIYKSTRLELLIMKIKLSNMNKNSKESKRLYLEASHLIAGQTFNNKVFSAIINEEGGKLDLRQKDYGKALEKFKFAFHNYKESGDFRAISVLKYAFLASITTRNRSIIVSPDEAKYYNNDTQLNAMVELYEAYEQMNISKINNIWNEKISKMEDDPFILENLKEILHTIRFNYIFMKLRAYKICTFQTLEKELGIARNDLISILYEMATTEAQNAKINMIENYIEIKDTKADMKEKEKTFSNYGYWIRQLSTQS